MNILINLIPIKKGGGQQVATNFVDQVVGINEFTMVFLVTENTYIHQLLVEKKANVVAVKNNVFKRFVFQYLKLGQIVKENGIDLIYTMFGPGLHNKNVISITGCAYSNLFFPEIDFWTGYSFLQKLKLKMIDRYRLKSTLKSDAIVFENEAMQRRASTLFKYPLKRTKLILPSISEYRVIEDAGFQKRLSAINVTNFNIVLLTGWHRNKNIEVVPHVLLELKKQNCTDVSFVITVPENHPMSQLLKKAAKELNVEERILFLDSVAPHHVPLLFNKIDGVGLFSLLESFSNNIIEAWHFKKPLFISDEEWSRAICKNAAVYVDRNSAKDIAAKIMAYRNDGPYKEKLELNMKEILKEYPTPKEKVAMQLEFIKKVYNEKGN